jgi:hypothetical protein
MTRRKRLIDAARPIFRRLGTPTTSLNRKNAKGKVAKNDVIYEAYLYSLVVEVLYNLGYSPTANPRSGTFRFRRAPGKLKSTPSKFSFVEFIAKGTQYELHCDTFVSTKSAGAVLELDVMIVKASEATACRSSGSDPSYNHVHLMLEAKYIIKGIGTGEAKAFLGIATSIHSGTCCDGLVTAGTVASNAVSLLTGATPVLTPYAEITAEAAHAANVAAFQATLQAQLPGVL